MDALITTAHWLTEHWPSLIGGGLITFLFDWYIRNRKARSEIKSEEAGTLKKYVETTASIITVYEDAATDFVEKYKDLRIEVRSLRGQIKRRDTHIEHLQQENMILREMKDVPADGCI